jgi:hypothetical protein
VKRCQQERYDVDSTLVKIMELFLNLRLIGTNAPGEEVTGRVGGECVGQVRCRLAEVLPASEGALRTGCELWCPGFMLALGQIGPDYRWS